MRVTHRQIEAFRALMSSGSVTEAARLLSVTQPAVSKIMSQLEEELGFSLFDRRQGKLNAREDAHILYAEVLESYSGLERVMRAAKRIRNRTGGNLRVAVLPTLAGNFIAKAVRRFYESAGDAQLSLQTYGSDEIVDLIASGLCDLGFATTPVDTSRIRSGPVMSVPSFCILPPGHRLAEKDAIAVTDLEAEPFVATAEGTASRLRIDSFFATMNVARNVQIEARWSMTISDLVQEGLGCSIVDGFTASSFADRGGIVRRLTDRLDFAFVGITHQFSLETAVAQKFQGAFEKEFDLFRTEIANRDFARSLPWRD